MRSSKLRISLSVAGLVMLSSLAFAQADQYQKALAAAGRDDAAGARDLFCKISDPSFAPPGQPTAGDQCATFTKEAEKAVNRSKLNYYQGVQLMDAGKFDEAEFKLKNVKVGEWVALAQAKLQELPAKRQQKAQADAAAQQASANESSQKQKLDQGVQAFNSGDFNSAKSLLAQAGPSGQNYLSRISQYESKMAEGQRLLGEKNYAGAIAAFGVAAGISSNGPGDPNGQMGRAQQLMAASGSTAPATPVKTAVKDEVKKVDVSATLAAAQKALNKKEYGRARILAGQVLATERGNAEAKQILADLPEEAASASSVSEEDPLLAAAIQQFYQANYSDAADSLKFYIFQKGKKQGLARFYLGATLATQYYLNGEQSSDSDKLQDAKKKFKEAKGVQGFNPPAKFVSPKIMRLYESAG